MNAKVTSLYGVSLPIGWDAEVDERRSVVELHAPGVGYATIDLMARGYRAGCTTGGKTINGTPYVGRGWKVSLLNDAIVWLHKVAT